LLPQNQIPSAAFFSAFERKKTPAARQRALPELILSARPFKKCGKQREVSGMPNSRKSPPFFFFFSAGWPRRVSAGPSKVRIVPAGHPAHRLREAMRKQATVLPGSPRARKQQQRYLLLASSNMKKRTRPSGRVVPSETILQKNFASRSASMVTLETGPPERQSREPASPAGQ